jgi:hypothetical protein
LQQVDSSRLRSRTPERFRTAARFTQEWLERSSFADANTRSTDRAFPKAARNYWKAQFLTELSDDAIRNLIAGFQECPSPMSHIIIEHFHGAASRVPVTATACAMRVTGFNVVIASQWMGSEETDRGIKWTRETFASLAPYLAPNALRQLPGRQCSQPRRGRLRTEPPAVASDQDEVRPREFLQTQRQHSPELRPIECVLHRSSAHGGSCRSSAFTTRPRGRPREDAGRL